MSEWEEKLGAILGNPQAMSQIMSLAQSLGASSQSSAPPSEAEAPAPSPMTAMDGLDPRLLTMASRILSEYNSHEDGRTALLDALRPFVKPQRYAKLDKAIQIARLSRLIRVALEAFKGGENQRV